MGLTVFKALHLIYNVEEVLESVGESFFSIVNVLENGELYDEWMSLKVERSYHIYLYIFERKFFFFIKKINILY